MYYKWEDEFDPPWRTKGARIVMVPVSAIWRFIRKKLKERRKRK